MWRFRGPRGRKDRVSGRDALGVCAEAVLPWLGGPFCSLEIGCWGRCWSWSTCRGRIAHAGYMLLIEGGDSQACENSLAHPEFLAPPSAASVVLSRNQPERSRIGCDMTGRTLRFAKYLINQVEPRRRRGANSSMDQ